MRTFMKNVRRSMMKNKKSFIGSVAIIGIGIFILVAMNDVMYNLRDRVNEYYTRTQFADIFAQVKEMPLSEVESLKDIEGIDESFGRLTYDARVKLDDADEIVTIHLLAYDDEDTLNQLLLSDESNEIKEDCLYLGSKMQGVYQFKEGDEISLILGSNTHTFKYVGLLKAPEYIYSLAPGASTPDGEVYDVASVSRAQLEKLLGKKGKVTEIGIKLEPGYSYEDVEYEITQRLEQYGLLSLCDKENQMSNNMLESELEQLYTMGSVLPAIFMVISIFMMYIVLKKMISQDRGLIGTMKAFGFKDSQLIMAYMKQSSAIGILGWLLGSLGATPLGKGMFTMYEEYFDLPTGVYTTYMNTKMIGLIVAVGTSVIATYLGIADILKINPAEAMRQSVPNVSTIKTPKILEKALNSRQKMGIRSIARNKFRSFGIAFSIAFPFGMIAVMSSFPSVMQQTFDDQFQLAKTYDLSLVFNSPQSKNDALTSAKELEYTYNVEGIFEYATVITHENRKEIGTIIAVDKASQNYHIIDINRKQYSLSGNGAIITKGLAKKLNLKTGDYITIDNQYLNNEKVNIPITEIIVQSFGEGIYIEESQLRKYFNLNDEVTSIILNCERDHLKEVKEQIKETKNITFITDSKKMLNNYQQMMSSMLGMVNMFKIISIIVGVIIIYNISNITIRERKNEFGTLQVLGITEKEIMEIVGFEQGFNFVIGILLGIPVSWFLKRLVNQIVATESYTLDIVIHLDTYLMSGFICLIIMGIAVMSMLKTINKIEPTDVLKERE